MRFIRGRHPYGKDTTRRWEKRGRRKRVPNVWFRERDAAAFLRIPEPVLRSWREGKVKECPRYKIDLDSNEVMYSSKGLVSWRYRYPGLYNRYSSGVTN